MIVTFCGNKEVMQQDAIREWLTDCVEALIQEGATDFYLGAYGAFDSLAMSAVRESKKKYGNV